MGLKTIGSRTTLPQDPLQESSAYTKPKMACAAFLNFLVLSAISVTADREAHVLSLIQKTAERVEGISQQSAAKESLNDVALELGETGAHLKRNGHVGPKAKAKAKANKKLMQ